MLVQSHPKLIFNPVPMANRFIYTLTWFRATLAYCFLFHWWIINNTSCRISITYRSCWCTITSLVCSWDQSANIARARRKASIRTMTRRTFSYCGSIALCSWALTNMKWCELFQITHYGLISNKFINSNKKQSTYNQPTILFATNALCNLANSGIFNSCSFRISITHRCWR